MVVALLVAGAWIAKRPHQYQATAQILVTPSTGTTVQGLPLLTESVDPTRTLQTAATILSSPKAALEAAAKLGGGWTPKKISDTVKVVPQGDSNIIAVTAKETSSAAAVAAANASARAALKVRSDALRAQADAQYTALEDQRTALGTGIDPATATSLAAQLAVLQPIRGGTDPNFQLQQPAGTAKLTGTSTKLILFLALMAGLVIGTAAALLLEQIDQRVRDEDDLLERYPLPVLARVPMSRRRGGGDGDPAVTPEPAIREAFRTLQVQLEEPGDEGRVIMLTSASMGDGKTTSAINLARALVAAGHRVVLLDLDLRKPDVGARLGVSSDVLGLFRSNVRLSDLLVPVPSTRALKVLSAPPRGDISPVLEALSRRLPELLAQARELADYVVIDTAPLGRVSDALRIAAAADDVLLVARPGNTDGKELTLAREQMEHMDIAPSGLVVVGSTGAVRSDYYGYVTDTPADVDGAATSLATLRSAAPAARQQQRRERGGERLS